MEEVWVGVCEGGDIVKGCDCADCFSCCSSCVASVVLDTVTESYVCEGESGGAEIWDGWESVS